MKNCTIQTWERIPEPKGEEGCFVTYKFTGLYDEQPFACKASFEIDGRDGEYEHISGPNLNFDGTGEDEGWDALLSAFNNTPSLIADMLVAAGE